jgi:Uma2 family endonuclease
MTGAGVRHSIIASNVYRALYAHVTRNNLGLVFNDGLIYILKRNPDGSIQSSRIPDTSFVNRGHIPEGFDLSRPFPGAPDLAVEVVSPSETTTDTADKINDYLEAGAGQVWVFYPDQQEVHQHIQGSDTIRVYRASTPIDTDAILPGLAITPAEVFALPELG